MKNNKIILVVDDESSMRKNIIDSLLPEGFKTFEAGDGKEALKKLNEVRPNIVLLDINFFPLQ